MIPLAALLPVATDQPWLALWPELTLVLLALWILLLEVIRPRPSALTAWIAGGGQAVVAVLLAVTALGGREPALLFGGLVMQAPLQDMMRVFLLGCGALSTYLAWLYMGPRALPRSEFFHSLLLIVTGFLLLVQSNHFLLFFVALELVTIGFYILVAYDRSSVFSLEGGLKYLVMGAFSSGILLFGIALLYVAASNPALTFAAADPLSFTELGAFLAVDDGAVMNAHWPLVMVGAVLVVAGMAFKIGAVPFHIWIPDVYQGAPTPVMALLAILSKAGGFFALIVLVQGPFAALGGLLQPLLALLAILTLFVGNLAPLGQRNIKRLMGLSGVSHAGFLLMGLAASYTVPWALQALVFYLLVYALSSFAVFIAAQHVAPREDADQELPYFYGLIGRQPVSALSLLVGLGSLAGIPPLAGFVAKFLLLVATFQAGLYGLLAVALVCVVLSIFYYFSWMRATVSDERRPRTTPEPLIGTPGTPARVVLVSLCAASVLLGLIPGLFWWWS